MKRKKVNPRAKKAGEAMLKELFIKYGVNFICDFEDVERGNPIYVALCEIGGEIKPSPLFPRQEIAETFVSLCKKHLPGFEEKKFRIYKLFER